MSTFTAWWLRKIVKNEVRPSVLFYVTHKRYVNHHFNRVHAQKGYNCS